MPRVGRCRCRQKPHRRGHWKNSYGLVMPSFSDEVIKSHGVVLRPLTEADVPAIAIACSDPQTQKWLPLPQPYTEESARFFALEIAPQELASGTALERAIEVDGQFVGVIGLKNTDWDVAKTELRPATGSGLGPEAAASPREHSPPSPTGRSTPKALAAWRSSSPPATPPRWPRPARRGSSKKVRSVAPAMSMTARPISSSSAGLTTIPDPSSDAHHCRGVSGSSRVGWGKRARATVWPAGPRLRANRGW